MDFNQYFNDDGSLKDHFHAQLKGNAQIEPPPLKVVNNPPQKQRQQPQPKIIAGDGMLAPPPIIGRIFQPNKPVGNAPKLFMYWLRAVLHPKINQNTVLFLFIQFWLFYWLISSFSG